MISRLASFGIHHMSVSWCLLIEEKGTWFFGSLFSPVLVGQIHIIEWRYIKVLINIKNRTLKIWWSISRITIGHLSYRDIVNLSIPSIKNFFCILVYLLYYYILILLILFLLYIFYIFFILYLYPFLSKEKKENNNNNNKGSDFNCIQ